jgi:hypothetical protein
MTLPGGDMRRVLLPFCSLVLASCAADDRTATVEQGLTSCESVGLEDWRGEELFREDVRNPTLVLTAGDSEETFYAWGVANGQRVLWVKRVPVDGYTDFMQVVHKEWAEREHAGADANYGVAGSISKGGPIPPPPPIGFPPGLVSRVLNLADAQLGASEHFFNGIEGIAHDQ